MAFHALQLLMELVRQADNTPMSASELALACGISEHFTQKIMRSLRCCGIVRSVKGIAGGHLLARSADRISLRDIILAVEGSVSLPDVKDKTPNIAAITDVWSQACNLMLEELATFNLAGICTRTVTLHSVTKQDGERPATAPRCRLRISVGRLRCRKSQRKSRSLPS